MRSCALDLNKLNRRGAYKASDKFKPFDGETELMILTKFQVLFRLLAARHRMGFKSLSERLAFYLQINPVLNVLTSLWMSSISDGNGITGRWARRLVSGGFGFGALRNMSPENRVIFATNVLGIHSKPGTGTVLTKIETDGYAALTKFVQFFDGFQGA